MKKLIASFFALSSLALLLGGCAPARRVQIDAGSTPPPSGLNIAQAQHALPSASPVPSQEPPTETFVDVPSESPSTTPTSVGLTTPPPPIGEDDKIVYLTFDDGPSRNTEPILQVLAEKDVPATFFILGVNADSHPERLKAIADAGHLVANHSYSHDTDVIYQSADALLEDIEKCRDTIRSILGDDYPTDLFRFPKGSTNKGCRDYRDAIKAAGYRYFDWNALNGDAETGTYKRTPEELFDRFKETVDNVDGRKNEVIVLMHDTGSKDNTVAMLGDAIDYLKSLGYEFRTMEHAQMK